jgi:hypothetical protein
MNADQKALLAQIEEEKRRPQPDKKLLKRLAHLLTSYDDREWDLKRGLRNEPGGRSRSPSYGIWNDYSSAY